MISDQFVDSFTRIALSPDPDLAVAALMIARLEYRRLDAGKYIDQLDMLGREAAARVASAADGTVAQRSPADAPEGSDETTYAGVQALNEYLFHEQRFVGNDADYDDPRNSFLNEVLDRRTGIPVTLALVYMEVARRAGLRVDGINFPGRFLVRCRASHHARTSSDLIVDVFNGGAFLSEQSCRDLLRRYTGHEATWDAQFLGHATKPQILSRVLLNLKRIYVRMFSFPQARDITELLLAVDPSALNELRDRGLLAYHLNDFAAALRDLQAYLQLSSGSHPDRPDRDEQEQIWEHVKTLRRRVASLN